MLSRRRHQGGFTILGAIIALAIIGVLTTNYFTTDTPTGQPQVVYTQQRARQAVYAVNLRTAQTTYFMQTEGRRPPPPELRRHMADLSNRINVGGRLFLDQSDQLQVTTNIETPRFREALGFPQYR